MELHNWAGWMEDEWMNEWMDEWMTIDGWTEAGVWDVDMVTLSLH